MSTKVGYGWKWLCFFPVVCNHLRSQLAQRSLHCLCHKRLRPEPGGQDSLC
ncbi:uncharacterized protein CCOS01_06271 [Colletotrichum costaricense]|uniref:Uncharacterized protein n=1 Tax=Colletotrichum costaricense TaxID=1209916 RepID=A0AAI9YXT5_9PEZI|nr:uncharacterized protein CCOS01_06271 [Colletotrichum costaricense]KAK1528437.1 hypothetical protein CCOS01_06271 [Colletotrichum costaricense]